MIPCHMCQATGPALLPVRYAVVPATITSGIPAWATPATAFPTAAGYAYALRVLRQGFVYVMYEKSRQWDAWSVTEDGSLWKQTSAYAALEKKAPDCTSPIHQPINIEHIVLRDEALSSTVWIAFSPSKWSIATLDRYTKEAAAREQRMQPVASWQWSEAADSEGITSATAASLNSVIDYQPLPSLQYSREPVPDPRWLLPFNPPVRRVSQTLPQAPYYQFEEEEVCPQGTLYPWSGKRLGQAQRTLAALAQRGSGTTAFNRPLQHLLVALHDPIGITHELAGWGDDLTGLHSGWLDELSIEFMTDQSLNWVTTQLEHKGQAQAEWVRAQVKKDDAVVEEMMKAGLTADQHATFRSSYQQAIDRNAQQAHDRVANQWEHYAAELNQPKRQQFQQCYQRFCQVLADKMEVLHRLRIQWLQTPLLVNCCQDFYSTTLSDNLHYRAAVDYALASLNLSPAGSQWLDTLINQYSAREERNLVWRSLLLNNPEVIRETSGLLQQMAATHGKVERVEEATLVAALAPLSGKLVDAYDRVNEVLERPPQSHSSFSQMMLHTDRRLGTLGDRFFNYTRLGKSLDGINELLTKSLFSVISGVAFDDAVKLSVSQLQQGDAFRKQILASLNTADQKERMEIKNRYQERFEAFQSKAEGASALKKSRIKLLALLFNSLEFADQLQKNNGNLKSTALITAAFLGTLSTALDITTPAVEHGIKNGAATSSIKFIGTSAGAVASVINLAVDGLELKTEFSREQYRWAFIGLNGGKVGSDIGVALKSASGLLEVLVERKLFGLGGMGKLSNAFKGLLARSLMAFLASWQLMLGVFFLEQIIGMFLDYELRNWCREGVFGLQPTYPLQSTRKLATKKDREQEYQVQEKKFQDAIRTMQ